VRGFRIDPPVGHHVDYSGSTFSHRLGRTFQCRANIDSVFHIFAMAAQRFGQFVETGIAEVAARLLAFGIASPSTIQADDYKYRQVVPHGSVQLHGVETECAVAME